MYALSPRSRTVLLVTVSLMFFIFLLQGITHHNDIGLALRYISTNVAASSPPPVQYERVSRNPGKIYKKKLEECSFAEKFISEDFYKEVHKQDLKCQSTVTFGGMQIRPEVIDGYKLVCMDQPWTVKKNACIVLSFGIFRDWTFDEAIGDYGCKVYSFDPTIGMPRHNRTPNVEFYPIGLSDKDGPSKRGQMLTFRSILKLLGLLQTRIDYVKIDIEGYEINFFNNIFQRDLELLDNIKQIGIEVHPDRTIQDQKPFWQMFHKLRCLNFQKIFVEKNHANEIDFHGRKEAKCYEIVWVNKNLL